MTAQPLLARRLWEAVEPLHAVVYFAPEPAEAAREVGLKGYWMGYFAGRLSAVGPVGAGVGSALCFAFAPGKVARALPDAWSFATAEAVLESRLAAVEKMLGRLLKPLRPSELDQLTGLLEALVDTCDFDGRALAAAWADVPRPDSLLVRLWLAATVLREHRGDGHVMALAREGLGGLAAGITHVAAGAVTRESIQGSRGWTDEEWELGSAKLRRKGLLDAEGGLTPAGQELRTRVEADTDRLASHAVIRAEAATTAIALAAPVSRALLTSGALPPVNPIGLPRPS
ncbi:SCO6745 family protein [Streptacidiphilus monticola]|jgi:hypothetical protein|uniref:SalK n=1 Tax=Streptacidiphilus monticola TaxID=2161674 RepID=A0ABW1GD63_9ACTN